MNRVTAADLPRISKAIERLEKEADGYPFVVDTDLEGAIRHVMFAAAEGNAFIGHGALLLVSDFVPWYGKSRVLQEDLILKLDKEEVNLDAVVACMESLAQYRGCSAVIASNSSGRPALSRFYTGRRKYTPITETFFKRIPNG